MKILLLGATGRTGKLLLSKALERGHQVNVIVRDKTKLAIQNQALEILEGDVTDRALLSEAINGCEAVVSVLNISRKSDFPWAGLRTQENFLENMLQSLLTVMNEQGIRRIIVCSAWGVGDSRKEIPGWFKWIIDHSNVGKAYAQHEVQEAMLAKSSLDWTAIRPVGLTNSKKLKELRVSQSGEPKPGLMISRKHTAKFMLDALEAGSYIRMTPTISEA